MKHAYFCWVGDDDLGVAIVAKNRNHAKQLAGSYIEGSWIEIHTRISNMDVRNLPFGLIDEWIGLELGIYTYLVEETCPRCHRNRSTVYWDGDFYCSRCEGIDIQTGQIDLFEGVKI